MAMKWVRFHPVMLLLPVTFVINSCTGITGSIKDVKGLGYGAIAAVNKATDTIEQAIQTLGTQSSAWQSTLQDLQQKLHDDAFQLEDGAKDIERETFNQIRDTADHVADLAQRSIAYAGVEARCDTDIITGRLQRELKNLIHSLRKEPLESIPPAICQVIPDRLDLTQLPDVVRFTGAALEQNKPSVSVMDLSTGEVPVPDVLIDRVSDYVLTLNVSRMMQANLLKPSSVKVVFKWGTVKLPNEIGVTSGAPVHLCGHLGEECCPNSVCSEGICSIHGCVAKPQCGDVGQPCCNATQCNTGMCSNGSCIACGNLNQPCCGGSQCSAGACTNGTCAQPPAPQGPPIFYCNDFSPNLGRWPGQGALVASASACYNGNATATGLSLAPGASTVAQGGTTTVYRCTDLCMGTCFLKDALTTHPEFCANQHASDTGLRVAPGASGSPAPMPGSTAVYRCNQLCSGGPCYLKDVLAADPNYCANHDASDTGLRVR